MQHEMAALENFGRRQRAATDAEKSKSAKVNVEFLCCLREYLSKSIASIGHTWTWHLNNTSRDNSRRNAFELAISILRIPVFTNGDFKKCSFDLFWKESSEINVRKGIC